MVKKIISIVAIMVLGSSMLFGCGSNYLDGKFYSLKEAYESELLSKEDLKNIAGYYNELTSCAIPLDEEIENAIKESAVKDEREQGFEAKADDFIILSYYGKYQDCYVIRIKSSNKDAPDVIVNEWEEIGGVRFHHLSYFRPEVWKAN